MDINVVIQLLSGVKTNHKTQIISDCPFCSKSGHFFINRKTLAWDCKKCKESGEVKKLLHKLGKSHLIAGEKTTLGIKNPILSLVQIESEEIKENEEVDRMCSMPIGFEILQYNDDNKYAEYLRRRKFTETDFDLYSTGYTDVKRKFEDYVIVSVINDYLLKAYVGRYIGNDRDKLRYNNSISKFNDLLFGVDEMNNRTESVLLVEGLFDKVSVTTELNLHSQSEFKCCCTFGNKISQKQIDRLKRFKNLKNIFLMWDARDSVNVMKKAGIKLKENFENVNICYLPGNDPGDSDADRLLESIDTAESVMSFYYSKVVLNKF